MSNRFKSMSGVLALTFMLLFGAVAFARTANPSMTNRNMGSPEMPSAPKEHWNKKRHHRRHHHHRHMLVPAHR